ncbi:MAG: TetR/AcrR family transcriptional regulator [Gammaproteobacteria bacterium]|nr:TetR/AcrR family transcriptional regulator [Gammaproteobacteria bacterium]
MSTGRPLGYDPEAALEAAMGLFWRRGYEATSLARLMAVTGLSKSSFYQAFGSKHALFERCMERYSAYMVKTMDAMLAEAPSGRVFVERLLMGIADETRGPGARRGCLVMNSASEFAGRDPVVADLVARSTASFMAVFRRAVERAKADGEIPPDKDTGVLAAYILTNVAGLRTMVKAGAGPQEVRAIAAVTLDALD